MYFFSFMDSIADLLASLVIGTPLMTRLKTGICFLIAGVIVGSVQCLSEVPITSVGSASMSTRGIVNSRSYWVF